MGKQPTYYVLQGGPELLRYWLEPEKWSHHKWHWTANKHVLPGDKAFIYLTAPQSRIVGEVDIIGEPFFNEQPYAFENPVMHDKWCVEVGNPIAYGNTWMLSMSNMRRLFSIDWGWVRYPRGNTRVPKTILPMMLEIVRQELKRKRDNTPCPRGCNQGWLETRSGKRIVCTFCSGH